VKLKVPPQCQTGQPLRPEWSCSSCSYLSDKSPSILSHGFNASGVCERIYGAILRIFLPISLKKAPDFRIRWRISRQDSPSQLWRAIETVTFATV